MVLPMNDPFGENHGHRSGPSTNGGGNYTLAGPTTPQRSFGFFPSLTPSQDPFAPIPSPHHIRLLLVESERVRMSLEQDLASAEQDLTSTQESLASTEQDLTVAQEEIKLRDSAIKSRDDQIKSQADEIRKLQAKIASLKKHIERQEITIRNQSRTIQDPRSLRQRRMDETLAVQAATTQPWMTPPQAVQSLVAATQSLSVGGAQQFAANNIDNAQYFVPHGHPGIAEGPGSQVPYQMSYPIESTASFMGTQPGLNGAMAGARLQGLFQPTGPIAGSSPMNMNTQSTMHQAAFATQGESGASSGNNGYAGIEFESKAAEFGGRFHSLWAKIDQFARHYVVNDELHPEQLTAPLTEHMMLDSNTAIAAQYLNHPMIKHLYVAKVINFYLCKKVLKYTEIVKNLNSSIDGEILNAKRHLTLGTSHPLIELISQKLANQMTLARQKPNFADFCSQRREDYTSELLSMLNPLVTPSEDNTGMKDSLKAIVLEAQNIGVDLYSCPYDARFHFPELNESYDPTVMVNLDPTLHVNIVTATVTMSVTPYVRLGFTHYEPEIRGVRPELGSLCGRSTFCFLEIKGFMFFKAGFLQWFF